MDDPMIPRNKYMHVSIFSSHFFVSIFHFPFVIHCLRPHLLVFDSCIISIMLLSTEDSFFVMNSGSNIEYLAYMGHVIPN